MGCPLYLAMTAAEFQHLSDLPQHPAWMSCYFSPNCEGITNLPRSFPPRGMLMLNDQYPVQGHDPKLIAKQLKEAVSQHGFTRVLLDFQRPNIQRTYDIVTSVIAALPCSVGVSHHYAQPNAAVLLPPVPKDEDLHCYLQKYSHDEVWLEVTTQQKVLTITKSGCQEEEANHLLHSTEHYDASLYCHYRIKVEDGKISFLLYRTQEDIRYLCQAAASLGVTCAVGIYQELK